MKKTVPLILILLISVFICDRAISNASNKPRSYEEIYSEVGYQTIDKAVRAFEQHFNKDVHLPVRLPSVAFTHQFARFDNPNGDMNDSLEVTYISDKIPGNHYTINVRPLKQKLHFGDKDYKKTYTLKSGKKAIYFVTSYFNFLVFETESWQYMLGIDKRLSKSNKVTPKMLIKIANSIVTPKKEHLLLK